MDERARSRDRVRRHRIRRPAELHQKADGDDDVFTRSLRASGKRRRRVGRKMSGMSRGRSRRQEVGEDESRPESARRGERARSKRGSGRVSQKTRRTTRRGRCCSSFDRRLHRNRFETASTRGWTRSRRKWTDRKGGQWRDRGFVFRGFDERRSKHTSSSAGRRESTG